MKRHLRGTLAASGLVLAVLISPPGADGQRAPGLEPEGEASPHRTQPAHEAELTGQVEAQEPRRWWAFWTRASDRHRLVGAMWTLHVHHLDEGWSNDGALALIHRGLYAATFETTHGPRAYSVGLERSWLSRDWRWAGAMLGFRTGLVYGYDGRLGWLADKYPVLPFAQPVIYTEVGPLAADFTYTWVVVSLSAAVRF